MKGINLIKPFACTEQTTATTNAKSPMSKQRYGLATGRPISLTTLPFEIALIAFGASSEPINDTIGPIITGGMILLIHLVPTKWTITDKMT